MILSGCLVRGMKRSGNHAIINWMNSSDNFIFFNNCLPAKKYKNRFMKPLNYRGYVIPRIAAKIWREPNTKKIRDVLSKPYLFSLEDTSPSQVLFKNKNFEKEVMIIRSAENLFASRVKKGFTRRYDSVYVTQYNEKLINSVELWKSYARYALENNNQIVIYYDNWLVNDKYRTEILDKLEISLRFNKPSENISPYGDGSSFGENKLDSDSLNYSQLKRRSFLSKREQDLLNKILEDNELIELQENIDAFFGNTMV